MKTDMFIDLSGTMLGCLLLLVLALWGGAVHWWSKRRHNAPLSLLSIVCELSSSAFTAVLFWLLVYSAGAPYVVQAVVVGWAAHFGTRTLYLLNPLVQRWLRLSQERDVIEAEREASDEARQ